MRSVHYLSIKILIPVLPPQLSSIWCQNSCEGATNGWMFCPTYFSKQAKFSAAGQRSHGACTAFRSLCGFSPRPSTNFLEERLTRPYTWVDCLVNPDDPTDLTYEPVTPAYLSLLQRDSVLIYHSNEQIQYLTNRSASQWQGSNCSND